jgi:hypothetical protein
LLSIANSLLGDNGRTDGTVFIESFGETELGDSSGELRLALPFTSRHVVTGDVTGDVVSGFFEGNVFAGFTDDDGLQVD